MAETLSYVHRFEKGTEADARSLLLLHGTDGDESDLVPLGRMLRKLNVLHRKAPKHVAFTNVDRLVFAGLYRLALDAVKTLKLESTSAGG